MNSSAQIKVEKSQVLVCKSSDPIKHAIELMSQNNVGSILVLNHHEEVQGIVTERDVLKCWQELGKINFVIKPVTRMMSSPVHTLKTFDLESAAATMIEKKVRHIPIVTDDGKLCGIISMRDIVTAFQKQPLSQAQGSADSAIEARSKKPVQTMHLLAPTGTIRSTLGALLPISCSLRIWDLNAVQNNPQFKLEVSKAHNAFFLDLDGFDAATWKTLLKNFIANLTHLDQPQIFMAWSSQVFNEEDMAHLRAVCKSADWHLYQKPLSIGALGPQLANMVKKSS